MVVMFGSVPANDAYRMCHGSVSLGIVTLNSAHAPRLALVM